MTSVWGKDWWHLEIRKFQKILVANRGEIALRIFRACYDLNLRTVAIYSQEDMYSLYRTCLLYTSDAADEL